MALLYAKREGGEDPHELVIDVDFEPSEPFPDEWTEIRDITGRRYEVRASACSMPECRCAIELRRLDD